MIEPRPVWNGVGSDVLITSGSQLGRGVVGDQHVTSISADRISAGVLSGVRINGGAMFGDTLGSFYPIVTNPQGGLTINGSNANPSNLLFHNTAASVTDFAIVLADSGSLFIIPNSTTSVEKALVIADRRGQATNYLGVTLYPAYTSGVTLPLIVTSTAVGTGTNLFFNGYTYSDLYTNGANYLLVAGTTAGGTPGLIAYGSDANVGIWLEPKGTGVVNFQYAVVALGGGAAPTVGTIGGSGPATAGQNCWVKIKADGTDTYLPGWR